MLQSGLLCVSSIDFPHRENCNNNLGRSGSTVTWFTIIPYSSRHSSQFPTAGGCDQIFPQPSFPASFLQFLFFSSQLSSFLLFPASEELQCSSQPGSLGSFVLLMPEHWKMSEQYGISNTVLVNNHFKMVLCFDNILFLSFGQRNVLLLSCSKLCLSLLLPFLKFWGTNPILTGVPWWWVAYKYQRRKTCGWLLWCA